MKKLSKQQEREVAKRMAEEFLEYRLSIGVTNVDVNRLAVYIRQFGR